MQKYSAVGDLSCLLHLQGDYRKEFFVSTKQLQIVFLRDEPYHQRAVVYHC
jgi:hypothetical protein